MKKSLAILVLFLSAVPAFGRPSDAFRDIGERLRDRIVRVIRVVTNGDALQPPLPAPQPKP